MGKKYLDSSGFMYHSIFSFLKRISLKELFTRWIWILMTCMVSSRHTKGTGPFFKFFRCSNDFITKKVYKCHQKPNPSCKSPTFKVRSLLA
jgi:hypothetical protein